MIYLLSEKPMELNYEYKSLYQYSSINLQFNLIYFTTQRRDEKKNYSPQFSQ